MYYLPILKIFRCIISAYQLIRSCLYAGRNTLSKAPPFVFPNYHNRFCWSHSAGGTAADAADFHNKWARNSIQRNIVHCYICCLRDRSCRVRYWELLVGLRADDYSGADSNRRPWRRNRSSIVRSAVRAKNLPDAAQHNTGCDLSTEGRWNRSTDTVHPAGDISNRTAGCTCYDAGILPGLWMARSLDGGVSFHISILQRWV